MHPTFKIVIKVIMAAMLFGCLLKWQYSYYQILRFVICSGFVLFAIKEYEGKRIYISLPCIAIAILFNPLMPIYLARETWIPVDLSTGVLLIVWIIIDVVLLGNYSTKEEKNLD
jgi:hypothetical protein